MRGVMTVDSCKTLRAMRTDEGKALAAEIVTVSAGMSEHSRQPLRLTSCGSGRAYVAWVLPIRPPHNGVPSCRFQLFSGVGPEPTALVLVGPVGARMVIPAEAIQTVFKLSTAEARLASALAEGHTMEQYAKQANVSPNTVRNQLAAVFTKTNTNRQTELVALIVGALGFAAFRRDWDG